MDHLPRRVTVAMYRTFLTREVIPVARGRYADAVLEVPTTLAIGDRDVITRGIPPGSVDGTAEPHRGGRAGSRALAPRAAASGGDRLVSRRRPGLKHGFGEQLHLGRIV